MPSKTLFHATRRSNISSIRSSGFTVSREGTVNIYGRGIYFWELENDSHAYGKSRFGSAYDIIDATVSYSHDQIIVWNSRYRHEPADQIARNLLRKGVGLILIPNHLIEDTTFSFAQGDAYCYLADLPY